MNEDLRMTGCFFFVCGLLTLILALPVVLFPLSIPFNIALILTITAGILCSLCIFFSALFFFIAFIAGPDRKEKEPKEVKQ